MQREYHHWHSPQLDREMELLKFGQGGTPVIVYPTSMGRFYQYEDESMIAAVSGQLDSGQIQMFCVDSVDAESWYNKHVPPRDRVLRHIQYEQYILHEVVPFIRSQNVHPQLAVTGCSFGGYHSVNFALRHPDLVTHCVSMGGAFDIRSFLSGYYDENAYFNCPPDFLPNLNDAWYWERYQNMRFVLAVGEFDMCLEENLRLSAIMNAKSIPHQLDVWGDSTGHDWPWWREMAVKFL
jgi:esterase/lipase superfamily enzyme